MKPSMLSSALVAALLGASAMMASAQTPAEVEGPISAIDATPGAGSITVMGMTILVPDGTPITTPSSATPLTLADLSAPSIPGLPGGLIGGTAIITGTVDAGGIVTADDVFSEPAENVILGVITQNDTATGGNIFVNLVEIIPLPTDHPVLPFTGFKNDLGIEIDPADLVVGTLTGVEGFYSAVDSSFHAFLVEGEGVAAALGDPQVGDTRAQGRINSGRLEVRGGLTGIPDDNQQVLQVENADTGAVLGQLTVVRDPADGVEVLVEGTALFRFRLNNVDPVPTSIVVRNTTSPSVSDVTEVAIR